MKYIFKAIGLIILVIYLIKVALLQFKNIDMTEMRFFITYWKDILMVLLGLVIYNSHALFKTK